MGIQILIAWAMNVLCILVKCILHIVYTYLWPCVSWTWLKAKKRSARYTFALLIGLLSWWMICRLDFTILCVWTMITVWIFWYLMITCLGSFLTSFFCFHSKKYFLCWKPSILLKIIIAWNWISYHNKVTQNLN